MVARLLKIHPIAMVHIKNYNFIIIFCLIISLSNQGCENKYPEGTNIKIEVDDGLDHLFFLPNEYQEHREKEWPLILFLHGMGERGDNLELIKIHGIPKISEETDTFPFIAISPQCPINHEWTDQAMQMDLIVLLESVIDNYRVDKDKIYVTGLSMGGYGTWSLLSERPDLFAAAVPICGGGVPGLDIPDSIKDVPIWVFHGGKDKVVPSYESEKMVRAIEEIGGNIKYTLYPDANHDSWTRTYENNNLYEWLLSHSKKN